MTVTLTTANGSVNFNATEFQWMHVSRESNAAPIIIYFVIDENIDTAVTAVEAYVHDIITNISITHEGRQIYNINRNLQCDYLQDNFTIESDNRSVSLVLSYAD